MSSKEPPNCTSPHSKWLQTNENFLTTGGKSDAKQISYIELLWGITVLNKVSKKEENNNDINVLAYKRNITLTSKQDCDKCILPKVWQN
jgi:hypothetical protein